MEPATILYLRHRSLGYLYLLILLLVLLFDWATAIALIFRDVVNISLDLMLPIEVWVLFSLKMINQWLTSVKPHLITPCSFYIWERINGIRTHHTALQAIPYGGINLLFELIIEAWDISWSSISSNQHNNAKFLKFWAIIEYKPGKANNIADALLQWEEDTSLKLAAITRSFLFDLDSLSTAIQQVSTLIAIVAQL